ncbi:MAG: rhamnulokinase [Prevotella sp.]|jgi:rhamnulokinase|nr:rhamnulokinase [Prevotella sp.]
MENKAYFFAVDLGATSGRTIIGSIADGRLEQEEITRFPNNLIETGGHFYWDIYALYFEMIRGLKEVARRGLTITSIGIDTWGVDFVFVGDDGAILRNPMAYRDPHTFEAMDDYLCHIVQRREVYDITGIQFMNFNSLFQLYAMQKAGNTAMKHCKKVLFVPDALSWMLTGEAVCEYTIASTSQMLDPRTGDLSERLIESVGLTRGHFGRMVQPDTQIGVLTEEVQKMTGLGPVPVIAVAGHDTGAAVAAVPAKNERFAYLSSGTWSLMGIETKEAIINDRSYELNFTNEGGIEGTTRFLKNICGMWLYERCRKEFKDSTGEPLTASHQELQGSAMQVEAFRSIINPDDAAFANPSSMIEAIQQYCRKTGQAVPETPAEICRCIFDSLALRYKQVFGWLKEFYLSTAKPSSTVGDPTAKPSSTEPVAALNVLHVIGGGSLNRYLNQFTADALGVEVLAGPQECTAIGNIMLQAKAMGLVKDVWEMRAIIAASVDMVAYHPSDNKAAWDEAYDKYLEITK